MKLRYELANVAAAILMQEGHVVFSPISHSYPISKYLHNYGDHNFWMNQDMPILKNCSEMIIIDDPNQAWKESKGVNEEISNAQAWEIPWKVRKF